MSEERITSRKNPLMQLTRRLFASGRVRQETGLFAADGTKLLAEAVKYCSGLETVILSEGVHAETPAQVRRIRVPNDVMASISPMESPEGAVFLCRLPEPIAFSPRAGMLLLDGIQDPGNLGTILRTADALEIPVVLLEGCADAYGPKTVRASMGAVFRTHPMRTTWAAASAACADKGIPIAAAALSECAKDIRCLDLKRYAIVIGSEGQGVRKEILDEATTQLVIPMNPRCESLNAAIAAAICMWQMKT